MLTVRISEEARSAIDAYCARNGITVTAWLEAVGRRIQQIERDDDVDVSLLTAADETVRIARLVDRERRARLPEL
jgi:hypothetical protein